MLRFFKIISILEGISLLGLLVITMPLKYYYDNPAPNQWLGMVHGMLFIAYVVLAFIMGRSLKWSVKTLLIVLVCSIIPFGTFWMDKKYLQPQTV
jgi:integral membrane protein